MVHKTSILHKNNLSSYKKWKENLKLFKYASHTIALSKGTHLTKKFDILVEIK